jgi:PST family polysaccharide transporter
MGLLRLSGSDGAKTLKLGPTGQKFDQGGSHFRMSPRQQKRNERALATGQSSQGLGKSAMQGGAIAFFAHIGRLVIHITGAVIMARLLTPADFGLIAMAGAVTAFIGLFTDLGLSAATVQRTSVSHDLVSTLFWVNLGAGLLLMLTAFAAAPVAAWFFSDPRITILVMALAVALPVTAATAQHNALLVRSMRWMPVQISGLGGQLAGLIAAVVLAWVFDLGYWALVAQAVVAAVTAFVMSWTYCKWRPSWFTGWRSARAEIGFGLNISGFNFLNYFHRQFDNVLIGWRWGPTELGYYSRAYNLLTLPITLINNSMGQISVPILSKLKEKPEEWSKAYLQMSAVTTFAGVGICILLLVSADPIIRILLGDQWTPVIDIFRLLSLSSVLMTSANTCGWIFVSLGRTKQYLRWALFASPLYVLSFVIGLPWKASGVALAYAAAVAILAPGYTAYALSQTNIRKREYAAWIGPIYALATLASLAGLVTFGAVDGLSSLLQLIICSSVVALLYLGGGYLCLTRMARYRPMHVTLVSLISQQWNAIWKRRKPAP